VKLVFVAWRKHGIKQQQLAESSWGTVLLLLHQKRALVVVQIPCRTAFRAPNCEMMNERHHNNTEPSVAVATEAMNRNELYGARGDFPDTDDISGPIEQGERERPEKRRKVGSDVAADDLKKPSATPDAVEIIADDAPLLSTNSEFTSTESMPPASAFASTGTAASAWTVEPAKPQQQQPMRLKQGMPAPTSFLSQQQQHLPVSAATFLRLSAFDCCLTSKSIFVFPSFSNTFSHKINKPCQGIHPYQTSRQWHLATPLSTFFQAQRRLQHHSCNSSGIRRSTTIPK
jgi:hypothetical protein